MKKMKILTVAFMLLFNYMEVGYLHEGKLVRDHSEMKQKTWDKTIKRSSKTTYEEMKNILHLVVA